jgi:hypothetical protein
VERKNEGASVSVSVSTSTSAYVIDNCWEQHHESHTCDKTSRMFESAHCLDRPKYPAGTNSRKSKCLVSRFMATSRFQASHFSADRPRASLQLVERTIVHAHTSVDFVVSNAREGEVGVSFDFLWERSSLLRIRGAIVTQTFIRST